MKAQTFEKLIRKIVREEIDYALRREIKSLKEDLRDEFKPTITEYTEETIKVPIATKTSLREKIMGSPSVKQRPKQRPKQNFVSDGTLNDLLNETAAGNTNTQTAQAPVNLSQPFSTSAPLPMDTTGMPKGVAEALTKDYSGLMKAINKKKGL